MAGACTCPYPFFPCKHAAALLYAYLAHRPKEDLLQALDRLSLEEAKGLLKALAQLPEAALWLAEALFPREAFLEGVRASGGPSAWEGGKRRRGGSFCGFPRRGRRGWGGLWRPSSRPPLTPSLPQGGPGPLPGGPGRPRLPPPPLPQGPFPFPGGGPPRPGKGEA